MFSPASGTISGRLDRQGHFGTYPYLEDLTETFYSVQRMSVAGSPQPCRRKPDAKREVQIKLLV